MKKLIKKNANKNEMFSKVSLYNKESSTNNCTCDNWFSGDNCMCQN